MWTGSLEDLVPVWIVGSPHNRVAVEAAWAHGTEGVTIFESDRPAEAACAVVIANVWLHHGPWSCDPPMARLEVLGARVTSDISAALGAIGFTVADEREGGFSASVLAPNSEPVPVAEPTYYRISFRQHIFLNLKDFFENQEAWSNPDHPRFHFFFDDMIEDFLELADHGDRQESNRSYDFTDEEATLVWEVVDGLDAIHRYAGSSSEARIAHPDWPRITAVAKELMRTLGSRPFPEPIFLERNRTGDA
ncbi:MAG: hypothetical protein HONBIEJF_00765 [Fimbriimonadaceae bacterium]|nr:hypothetical protein [Fimbriimonadaceae bacterium]